MILSFEVPKVKEILAQQSAHRILGRVNRVVGLIIEGSIPEVPVGASCRILCQEGQKPLSAEVIGLKNDQAILMPIGNTTGIRIGDPIEVLSNLSTVKVSNEMLGRVLDGSGEIMDQGSSFSNTVEKPLYQKAFSPVERQLVDSPMGLGIRSIDGFLTCGIGMRMMILAGSGVGKSTLLGMISKNALADVNVIGLIGERGREVREFLEENLGEEGLKKSVVVVATSDQPALVRMRAAFVTTTIAEHFRDQGKKVLLMMDSLTRFAMASREVGLALGEPPTMKGYTPSLFSALPQLLERAGTSGHSGSITGLYTVLMEGDDIQDPVADTVRSIVDGHIVLSRKLTSQGFYPPIDVLQSLSRVMSQVVNKEHKEAATKLRRLLSMYEEMADYIRMGVYSPGKNADLDLAVQKNEAIKNFLKQDVSEATTYNQSVAWLQQLAM